MFLKNKIVFVLLLFISIFWYVVFSDAVNTHYTEFYFVSGSNHYKNLSVNLTWWETGHASFYLENKSNSTININMSFVDSETIFYGSTWVRVCKSENEKNEFGNYVDMVTSSFSLLAWSWITESLDLLFPAWYSWVYNGCILYYPNVVDSGGNTLNTLARKAIFLDVDVVPTDSVFVVKVYPSNRSDSQHKWNEWKLLLYANGDRTSVLYSWYLTTNTNWTWNYTEDIPTWLYDIVYKWQSHLWSYLSGVFITWWQELVLDFTTWTNLFYTNHDWVFEYQVAWDMKNSQWVYDWEINVWDITMLIWSSDYYGWNNVDQWNINNLNGDSLVTSADLSVIIDNFGDRGPYYMSSPEFWWFSW